MQISNPRAAPRAFYPEYVHNVTAEPKTPGWDPGPELRLRGRETLRRAIAWSSAGLAAVILALPRGRAQLERALAAAALVAFVGAVEVVRARRWSWVPVNGGRRNHG